ncbi:MAG TPA: hypothetical protein PLD30_08245 [Candidatus Competibacteraceae bacterium]|nr:hypothetical protein [Candidatus Competibacteraceae bacterium]
MIAANAFAGEITGAVIAQTQLDRRYRLLEVDEAIWQYARRRIGGDGRDPADRQRQGLGLKKRTW